ncbi:MAG: T9SS type A sorting domain-containing protein [Chitinophagales bacterium]|nr:T9SS type A sorting domain-containing protein [Chitinophagales bacterium]
MAILTRRVLISTPFSSDLLQITVTNNNGVVIKSISTWDDQYDLNLRDLPPGDYLITVQKGETIKNRKVLLK